MTDSMSLVHSALQATAPLPVAGKPTVPMDPAESRLFALHMSPGGGAQANVVGHVERSAVPPLLQTLAEQMKSRPISEMQKDMLASIDPDDPMKSMVAMSNFSMEATTSLSRLHLCSSLATAATSLLSGLLKNQQ